MSSSSIYRVSASTHNSLVAAVRASVQKGGGPRRAASRSRLEPRTQTNGTFSACAFALTFSVRVRISRGVGVASLYERYWFNSRTSVRVDVWRFMLPVMYRYRASQPSICLQFGFGLIAIKSRDVTASI